MPQRIGRLPSVDPLDSSTRIRFSENVLPLHRLDSAAIENATLERDEDTATAPTRVAARNRSYSISQNAELKEALLEPGREPGVDVNNLELDM